MRGPAGCLLLVAILVIILLMLSILFGGFQLGKKAAPASRPSAGYVHASRWANRISA
jgi:hypothetical protein